MNFKNTLLALSLLILLSSCSLPWETTPVPSIETGSGQAEVGVELTASGQTKEDRLVEAKRRQSYKSIIRKGDYFSLKNDKEAAIKYYLSAYVRLKDDNTIERKLANTYFDLKQYEDAYKYYKRVPFIDLEALEKTNSITALMFDESTPDKKSEIAKFPISPDERAYYGYIETCYAGIHNCVIALEAYSGSVENIKKLSDITHDYAKVSTDFQYRNMLLAWALFEGKQYLASAKIAEEIVEKRPDYHVALKIAGYSYFELWKYKEANNILARYYTFDPKNVKIAYTLGLTNYYLEDFSTSNLYYNTAVLNGYAPKTELERRMVYNYFMLDDRKSMFKIFRYLLDEADVSDDDYIIAIHTAVDQKEIAKGLLWANKGLEKFSNSDMIYALRWAIHFLRNDSEHAYPDLEKSLSINPHNALALVTTAKLHFAEKAYTEAKEICNLVIESDKDGIFWQEAATLLDEITQAQLTETGSINGTGTVDAGDIPSNQ